MSPKLKALIYEHIEMYSNAPFKISFCKSCKAMLIDDLKCDCFMATVACDACGELCHLEFVHTNEKGTFCNEDCANSALQGKAVQLPLFEGWDEGSPVADLTSRQHNKVFSDWERTARM